ncbi:MAG: DUF2752 domain-containing protein [Verrucomicrobiota bacterium]|nr:DUF2752 domain-containing protein [Verrucomicrobiota bacterium]
MSTQKKPSNSQAELIEPTLPRETKPPWFLIGFLSFLVVLVAACVFYVIFVYPPANHSFYPKCKLYEFTGVLCPGCGGLRGTYYLSHGQLGAAAQSNLILVGSLFLLPTFGAIVWLRKRPFSPALTKRLLMVVVVFVVGYTLLRNIHLPVFNNLRPPPLPAQVQ